MIYKCELCNYSANSKKNLNIHMLSKKHLEKEQEGNNLFHPFQNWNFEDNCYPKNDNNSVDNSPDIQNLNDKSTNQHKYMCKYCNNCYVQLSGLNKHLKKCSKKTEIEKEEKILQICNAKLQAELEKKDFEMKLILKEKELEMLKEQISTMKEDKQFNNKLIECNTINMNGMIKTNMSALNFLNTNFKNNPCLESFDKEFEDPYLFYLDKKDTEVTYDGESFKYKNNEKPKDEYVADKVLDLHKGHNLVNYYCDKITEYYKHENNPYKQSCWSTDSARNNFTVCEENPDKSKGWRADKKGLIMTKKIIKPLLDFTVNVVQLKINLLKKKLKKVLTIKEINDISKKINLLNEFIESVDENKIQPDIIRKLSPIFFLDVNKQQGILNNNELYSD